ncbi:scavenger receptor cysteine-rich type 1 protein M130-like isoform X2 [Eucyclogobius newberryi]|uniref:scavenger receptor cysteine-rich type 1 protein M130-like isoform X2 n=1 Tax=Eucyclogobius newberryi TaxID=166745 RepID=UPI003B5B7E88
MAKNMHLFGAGQQQLLWFIILLSLPLCTDCDEVRLSPSKCSGRVEVFHDGRWGTVCNDHWSTVSSQVLCRQLGCGPAITTKQVDSLPPSGPIWLDDVQCNGEESSILSCKHSAFGDHNCDHSEDIQVSCSDALRLTNGTNRCSGTLEVYSNGEWGALCNKNLAPDLATMVCEGLDCGRPKNTDATMREYMGYTSSCAGNATSVSACGFTKSSDLCHGIALSCEGFRGIRLVNGTDRCSGRVEVYFHRQWGTICDDDWDIRDAQVACRALDCGVALKTVPQSIYGEGTGAIWLDNVECAGNESDLVNCGHNNIGDHNCGHGEDAGVICSPDIRLINGTTGCSGIVEFTVDGQWSSARRSTWGMNEASVVCRMMDCGEVLSFSGSNSANEPSRIHDVSCKGTESSLRKCTLKAYNQTSSAKSEDATVVCTGKTLLSDGPNRCAGRVEVYHKGLWADVCTESWDLNAAQVVCQQLNCGPPHKIITSSGRAAASVWVNQTDCGRHELTLSSCPLQFTNQSCASTTVAGVICSDGLVVRLGNGQDRCSGRVEIRHGDQWGTVCSSAWNQNKAKLVCDVLECGHVVNASTVGQFPPGTGTVYDASDACFTSLKSIHQCSRNGFTASTCGHGKDTGIICGGDSSIKLLNGTDRCSGRVEILYNAQWGTVCDDEWDISDAEVVCRSKDCGSPLMAVSGGFFGQGAGKIWLDNLNCLGNESSLIQCEHPTMGDTNCVHGEDAGVICSPHLRIVDGRDQCSGSVEFYYDGEWLPAVNVNWGMNEAAVVCREMNCGDANSVSGSFSQTEVQRGFRVSCTGRESSLTQCSVRPYLRTNNEKLKYASVTCSGIVKLVDGPNRCAGRVEMFKKKWGNVCGQSWDMSDAQVVCQQLNCGKAFKITTNTSPYGLGRGTFIVEHIECNGRESLLEQCTVTHGGKECNSSSVATVICSDSMNIRLVDGSDQCSGRVEVRMGSGWGTMCGADWSTEKAETLCELLDCGQAINSSTVSRKATVPVSDPAQTCFSNVQSLKQCLNNGLPRATCAQDDASVTCAAHIRLMGGPNACSGRVEVFHKGEWGTVCDDDWGMEEAHVVCKQMGCGIPVSVSTGSSFGRGKGQIWLDNMECIGAETALTQCPHSGLGNHNCGHEEDAGVTCLDTLQKPKLFIRPGVSWGDTVDVTCIASGQQTGGTFTLRKNNDTFKMEKVTTNEAAVFTLLKVNLSHSGFYYCEYRKNMTTKAIYFPKGDAVELTVTVRLEKPKISVTSLNPVMIHGQNNISISRGYSFNLTCSIHSLFPGGFFNLTKSKMEQNRKTKPAVYQSGQAVAVFEIPSVQYLDKGEYSCTFVVNMSSRMFESFPSESIHVTVVASASASVAVGVVIALLLLVGLLLVGYFVWRKKRWSTDNMVRFVNRLGGALQNIGSNGSAGAAVPRSFTNVNVDMDGIEDPPGIVFHDHEPLVYSK